MRIAGFQLATFLVTTFLVITFSVTPFLVILSNNKAAIIRYFGYSSFVLSL